MHSANLVRLRMARVGGGASSFEIAVESNGIGDAAGSASGVTNDNLTYSMRQVACPRPPRRGRMRER
jgi:hypothetical protein